jgi:hypothetical protein
MDGNILALGFLTLYISLFLSAYFLLRQQKAGIWITYFQFPLRLLFMVLSFGFILGVVRLFDNWVDLYDALMWGVLGLEICRLLATIYIQRKYFAAEVMSKSELT